MLHHVRVFLRMRLARCACSAQQQWDIWHTACTAVVPSAVLGRLVLRARMREAGVRRLLQPRALRRGALSDARCLVSKVLRMHECSFENMCKAMLCTSSLHFFPGQRCEDRGHQLAAGITRRRSQHSDTASACVCSSMYGHTSSAE